MPLFSQALGLCTEFTITVPMHLNAKMSPHTFLNLKKFGEISATKRTSLHVLAEYIKR